MRSQVEGDKDRLLAEELAIEHVTCDGQRVLPLPGETQFSAVVMVGYRAVLAANGAP